MEIRKSVSTDYVVQWMSWLKVPWTKEEKNERRKFYAKRGIKVF